MKAEIKMSRRGEAVPQEVAFVDGVATIDLPRGWFEVSFRPPCAVAVVAKKLIRDVDHDLKMSELGIEERCDLTNDGYLYGAYALRLEALS